mmetsp:Transcript_39236/g.75197  ORF Transcript_39236/g.75197 Transcript_39236/m.75197 type:complete len:548 (+) Transcript_39236:159-1802(+)|eukprot:CAMPEP_0114280984 /NCGR_PEP_ID=MMETSP0059-20121206/2736_1 /TAXON_ID=36894 /ORGANISM="Pyramimonas parkeae, Strain CCMP726" /LENGTH=547 /DNA_ID=CAMNT_0001401435 /DNA_START=96 /DNA_END=1739 /DNA_ORIENTATION=+
MATVSSPGSHDYVNMNGRQASTNLNRRIGDRGIAMPSYQGLSTRSQSFASTPTGTLAGQQSNSAQFRTRFPPLEASVSGLALSPGTAPAHFERTLEEIRMLRDENETLKRELVERLRGNNNKFVAGGHFRGQNIHLDSKCKSCASSSRAAENFSKQAQKEARQRLQVQTMYDEERHASEIMQKALTDAEATIESLRAQQIPTPPDADAAADADIRADLSDDLERARRDSTLALQQNAHLDQALEAERRRVSEMSAQADEAEAAHSAQIKAMSETIFGLEDSIGKLHNRVNELENENINLTKSLNQSRVDAKSHEALQSAMTLHQADAAKRILEMEVEQAHLASLCSAADERCFHLAGERDLIQHERDELERKLALVRKQAMRADIVEEDLDDMRQKFQTLQGECAKHKAELVAANGRIQEEQKSLASARLELRNLQIEQAAAAAQLESMVQLVVVAPSVNVSLGGDFPSSVFTHEMKCVNDQVSNVINNDVMPKFLRVFSKCLPTGTDTGSLPNGYVDQLIVDMQSAIGEHLQPVLQQAWARPSIQA